MPARQALSLASSEIVSYHLPRAEALASIRLTRGESGLVPADWEQHSITWSLLPSFCPLIVQFISFPLPVQPVLATVIIEFPLATNPSGLKQSQDPDPQRVCTRSRKWLESAHKGSSGLQKPPWGSSSRLGGDQASGGRSPGRCYPADRVIPSGHRTGGVTSSDTAWYGPDC